MENLYEVNGIMMNEQQFQEIQNNPKKKLVEVSPGKFKILEKMYG